MFIESPFLTKRENELLQMLERLLYAMEKGEEPPFEEAAALVMRLRSYDSDAN